MVSDGKNGVGAGKLTGEVLDIIANVPQVVSKLTGVNITNVSWNNFFWFIYIFNKSWQMTN